MPLSELTISQLWCSLSHGVCERAQRIWQDTPVLSCMNAISSSTSYKWNHQQHVTHHPSRSLTGRPIPWLTRIHSNIKWVNSSPSRKTDRKNACDARISGESISQVSQFKTHHEKKHPAQKCEVVAWAVYRDRWCSMQRQSRTVRTNFIGLDYGTPGWPCPFYYICFFLSQVFTLRWLVGSANQSLFNSRNICLQLSSMLLAAKLLFELS